MLIKNTLNKIIYSFSLVLIINPPRRSFFFNQIINSKLKYVDFKKDDTITYFYYNKLNYFDLYVNKIEEVNKSKFGNESFNFNEKLIKSKNEM